MQHFVSSMTTNNVFSRYTSEIETMNRASDMHIVALKFEITVTEGTMPAFKILLSMK